MFALLPSLALTLSAAGPGYARPELLADPAKVVKEDIKRYRVLDVRGKPKYDEGHIPGAAWVDVISWGRDFTKKHDDAEAWGQWFGQLAIDPAAGNPVLVYGDDPKDVARVWWILRYWGVKDARILDGGWAAWRAAGGESSVQPAKPDAQPVRLTARKERLATKEKLLAGLKAADRPQLVDARTADEHCGIEDTAKRNGAIPGAVHLDWAELIDAKSKRFKSAEDLSALFKAKGIDPTKPAVTYCQSGGRAAVMAFALELMGGQPAANYYRSWSEWGNAEDTPIVKPEKK